ncbi:hypothetical protein AOL_s00079g38 [Orbilia oligospora ATCC 24927]|uniref:ER membrane protein complex subunit 4 n=2 Tax=Orbilia oligospora TaxID=2813651 RepID=G1XCK3_ARTOA|nr:hypothetical protein AOL_s00079g38 [Orbilia oligospora ATCC 24927]EGX49084.1 hypothetical protein AOL_s00079g38 [Orbilia oligospora ATCC 24927]KAF3284617.1 hypothetical protein TWF970_010914 [Orbilia oligospora]
MALSQPAWVIDLKTSPSSRPKAPSNVADPPGYSTSGSSKKSQKQITPPTQAETDDLKIKKAWEVALAPAKSLPMNMIMMYMSGNTLQIFSIMMTAMLFMNPLRALSSVGNTFSKFDGEATHGRLLTVKLAYIGLQILTIVIGIWKVNAMGLLPTTRSDWLAWEHAPVPLETSISNFR